MRFVPRRILHGLLAGRYLPIWTYVVFLGALVSAILSTVGSPTNRKPAPRRYSMVSSSTIEGVSISMTSRQSQSKASRGNTGTATKRWASLTWEDLDRWAGSRSVSRGRTYQRGGRVKDLAVSDDGRLLATIVGGDRYVASVWWNLEKKKSGIESRCTCPVGYSGCKHAVAVVADYLQ